MSIPFSPLQCTHSGESVYIHDLFLDSEERYEVYEVKAAERPHLLQYTDDDDSDTDDNADEKKSSDSNYPPPLIDGCDLPGWRKEGLLKSNKPWVTFEPALNIGSASTMFRRERQWPVCTIFTRKKNKDGYKNNWEILRDIIKSKSPERDSYHARTILHEEYIDVCKVPIYGQNSQEEHKGTATRFAVEIEQGNIPVKIIGATVGWECMPKYSSSTEGKKLDKDQIIEDFSGGGSSGWTFANLLRRYGNIYWRFSDTHGEMMSLGTYAKYISNLEGLLDDSPLAIYDAEFGNDDSPTSDLTNEYSVPYCFSNDIFDLAVENNERGRPPWRWILIGPERSGTGLHIDPLWTNAWVTLLQGRKKWMLFPPQTPPQTIGMTDGPQIASVIWFLEYYDLVTSDDWPEEWRPVEVIQEPGETVFVPNGWPHLVLNLELTVAVTHNYASEFGPFERMWREVVVEESEFAERWYRGMLLNRRDLAQRAFDYHTQSIAEGESWALDFSIVDPSTI